MAWHLSIIKLLKQQRIIVSLQVLRAWEAEVGEGIFVKAEDFGMDKTRIREIWAAYIDILHRLKLWNCATDIIKTSDDAAMAELNQKGTSVVSACGACGTTCNPTSRCSKCAAIVSECSLCRQPVNGLFVWCPGCSHGGHLTHVHAWFSTHDVCPRGCGHKVKRYFKNNNLLLLLCALLILPFLKTRSAIFHSSLNIKQPRMLKTKYTWLADIDIIVLIHCHEDDLYTFQREIRESFDPAHSQPSSEKSMEFTVIS